VSELNSTSLPGLASSCKHLEVTVTVNEHVGLPGTPGAVHVTVVTPIGNVEPEAGLQATVAPAQLSLSAGGAKLTAALLELWQPDPTARV